MHRFYVEDSIGEVGGRVCLNVEESAHAARVREHRLGG